MFVLISVDGPDWTSDTISNSASETSSFLFFAFWARRASLLKSEVDFDGRRLLCCDAADPS